VFTYSAICDVPEQTLLEVTALLHAYRREIGTRAGCCASLWMMMSASLGLVIAVTGSSTR
jgi:hypothetical protein